LKVFFSGLAGSLLGFVYDCINLNDVVDVGHIKLHMRLRNELGQILD
jgi:hypothetical protein